MDCVRLGGVPDKHPTFQVVGESTCVQHVLGRILHRCEQPETKRQKRRDAEAGSRDRVVPVPLPPAGGKVPVHYRLVCQLESSQLSSVGSESRLSRNRLVWRLMVYIGPHERRSKSSCVLMGAL